MKIEFVKYTGDYPNLCRGVLVLKIDGEIYSFGEYPREDPTHQFYNFWESGGSVWFDREGFEHVRERKWILSDDAKDLPDFLKGHEQELIDVMNSNVPYGCCGGCI